MFFLCRRYFWDNIGQIKTLCSFVQEAPNNIAQVKTLYNVVLEAPDSSAKKKIIPVQCCVVLILLGQHCTGQNPMQCCPRCSRQHFIRKNFVQSSLNTLETTLHRTKAYAMLSEGLYITLHKKKSCAILC